MAVCLCIVSSGSSNREKIFFRGVLLLICIELFLNAEHLYFHSSQFESSTVDEYTSYVERVTPLVEYVKDTDGLFRTVLTGEARRTGNDSFLFNLYGLDSYTSQEKEDTHLIGENLGYATSILYGMHYNDGATMSSDSLLGVKYIISSQKPDGNYAQIKEQGGLVLYENENAMPIAFLTNKDIEKLEDEDRVFEYINNLFQSTNGNVERGLFIDEKADFRAVNCKKNDDGTYISDGMGYVEYSIKPEMKKDAYVYYVGSGADKVSAWINGKEVLISEQKGRIKKLGELSPEDMVYVRVYISEGQTVCTDKIEIYSEDISVLAKHVREIREKATEVYKEKGTKTRIQCVVKEDDCYLVCTVPYDDGWHIKVDGKAAEVRILHIYWQYP